MTSYQTENDLVGQKLSICYITHYFHRKAG